MTRDVARFALRLAWQQTLRRARQTALGFVGVTAGIVMVLLQFGFQSALYESALRLPRHLNGEIAIVPGEFRTLHNLVWFPRAWLRLVEADPAVEATYPLYLAQIPMRNIEDQTLVQALAIGIEPDRPALRLAELGADADALRLPGEGLFDDHSQTLYGDISGLVSRGSAVVMQTSLPGLALQRRLTVTGLYRMGGTIVMPGTVMMSAESLRTITGLPEDRIPLGVVRLKPGEDAAAVSGRLTALLPPEAVALPVPELIDRERDFWKTQTPIGFLFDLGAAAGFLVSAIYVWQVLAQTVEDHLSEYAVLKGMSYPNSFFILVISSSGALLILFAVPLAVLLAAALYWICGIVIQLDMVLSPMRIALVALASLAVSVAVGLFAARRLHRADLANLL